MTLHELAANLGSRLCAVTETEPDRKKERRIVFALEGVFAAVYSPLVILVASLVLGRSNKQWLPSYSPVVCEPYRRVHRHPPVAP